MAQFYTGEQFWTDRAWTITATSPMGKYASRTEFIESVNHWMDQHKITYNWAGESTHTHDNDTVYHYQVKIANHKDRTLFALRWTQ